MDRETVITTPVPTWPERDGEPPCRPSRRLASRTGIRLDKGSWFRVLDLGIRVEESILKWGYTERIRKVWC